MGAYTKDRLTRSEAEALSKKLLPVIGKHSHPVMVAGSYRRGAASIGDLDFVVVECDMSALLASLVETFHAEAAPRAGEHVMTVIVPFGKKKIQVEFVGVEMRAKGSGMLHSTGSGKFNVGLRSYAKGKGLLLNQHGLWRGGKWMAGRTEQEVFNALGFREIPPAERDTPFAELKKKYLQKDVKGLGAPKPEHGKTWKVKSKSTGETYYVALDEKKWSCTCKHFQFRGTECKHIALVKAKKGFK
jgi:hypothetical protein